MRGYAVIHHSEPTTSTEIYEAWKFIFSVSGKDCNSRLDCKNRENNAIKSNQILFFWMDFRFQIQEQSTKKECNPDFAIMQLQSWWCLCAISMPARNVKWIYLHWNKATAQAMGKTRFRLRAPQLTRFGYCGPETLQGRHHSSSERLNHRFGYHTPPSCVH